VKVIKGGYWFDGLERVGVIGSKEILDSIVDEVNHWLRSVAA
jgi:hypothetical protein